MRFMEGINSIGKASNTNTMAMTVITEMVFGRCNTAMLICCLRQAFRQTQRPTQTPVFFYCF